MPLISALYAFMTRRFAFIPLAICLMLFPSLICNVVLDGAESTYYGFPIPWNSRSLVTSLSKDVYLIPLILDFVFYALISFHIWNISMKLLSRIQILPRSFTTILVWTVGVVVFGMMCFIILSDPTFFAWYSDEFKITKFRLGLGV